MVSAHLIGLPLSVHQNILLMIFEDNIENIPKIV